MQAPRRTPDAVASDRDDAGVPVHRGWAPLGGRHRWMEPFVLVLLAGGGAHGYAITAQLEEMGITGGPVDIGQVYRTLRDLEEAGQVTSSWSAEPVGPQRRDYELTDGRLRGDRRLGGGHEGAGQAHRRVQRPVSRGGRGATEAGADRSAATAARRRRGRCRCARASFSSAVRFRSRTPR